MQPPLGQAVAERLHKAVSKPFVWTIDADLIFDRVKKVVERASDSGHQAISKLLANWWRPGE